MAVATLPVLAGFTLPAPKSQDYNRLYRGGSLQMASGKTVHDLVDATARHRFSLNFINLTEAQLATVQNAFDAIKNTTATYTSVRNTTHTVTRPDGGELDITIITVMGGQLAYNVTMPLLEDS